MQPRIMHSFSKMLPLFLGILQGQASHQYFIQQRELVKLDSDKVK